MVSWMACFVVMVSQMVRCNQVIDSIVRILWITLNMVVCDQGRCNGV